jgi:glycosyltransferase involved in cell wall biosynthesis
MIPILQWTGTPVAVNVDGLERHRKKWNALGRLHYALGERASLWFASRVVTDARVIRDYYKERYAAETTLIAYGAEARRKPDPETIGKFRIEPGNYVLYLSRLEPENNAAMVIEAFRQVKTDLRLVIVGDASYADRYKEELRAAAAGDERIMFLGAIYGSEKKAIEQNAAIYVHATEVGGTHPALVEAMGAGNCCVVYDTPENREVAADAGLYYSDAAELTRSLSRVLADDDLVSEYRQRAQSRVRENYDWEAVTDEYERLLEQLTKE